MRQQSNMVTFCFILYFLNAFSLEVINSGPFPWLWLFYLHFPKSYYLWSTICQVNRTDNCTQYHINIGLMMKELNIWFPSDFCSSKKQISLFKTTGKMHAEVISNLAEQICLDCWKSFPIIWSNSQALRLCIDCRLLP